MMLNIEKVVGGGQEGNWGERTGLRGETECFWVAVVDVCRSRWEKMRAKLKAALPKSMNPLNVHPRIISTNCPHHHLLAATQHLLSISSKAAR